MKRRKAQKVTTLFVLVAQIVLLLSTGAGCAKETSVPTTIMPEASSTPIEMPEKTVTVTDLMDRTVEVPRDPQRVVVIYSQIPLAMKCLGVELDKVVGVDEFTLRQYEQLIPELQGKSIVGQHFMKPDYEKIIDLEPQLVLATSTTLKRTEIEEKLEPAGIKIIALDFKIKNLRKTLEVLAQIFGKEERAKEFADSWFGKLEEVQERVEGLNEEQRVRVYPEGTQRPYVAAGKGSTLDELITLAGGINIAAGLKGRSPEVEPEWVMDQNPDVILKYPMGAEHQGGFGKEDTAPFEEMRKEIAERPGFDQIDAVKEGQVYILSRDILGGMFENVGVCYTAKILYPETFEDLDPEAYLAEIVEKYLGLDFEPLRGVFVYPSPPVAEETQ